MKKLLVIAVMSLFAVSAFAAVDVELSGFYEVEGRMIINNNAGDGDTYKSESYIQHKLRIWAKLLVDPNTTITVRATPFDDRLFGDSDASNRDVVLDRGWITYRGLDMFTVSLGRMTGNNYTNGFASGFYNGTFLESGARDQIRFDFDLFGINVFAVYEKGVESSTGQPLSNEASWNGWDRDSYILGADLQLTDDFFLIPVFAFTNDATTRTDGDTTQLFGVYVSAEYRPARGINAILSGSYVGGNNPYTINGFPSGDDLSVYGFYGDLSYVDDFWSIGVLGAYASYDADDGAFNFGGDFDKTSIIDDLFGDSIGVAGMTMFQLYGTINPMERLQIGLSGSYYFSNIDSDETLAQYSKSGSGLLFGDDTQMWEVDVDVAYAMTESTIMSVGYAYAQFNDLIDVATGDTYDSDAIHKIYWNVYTEF